MSAALRSDRLMLHLVSLNLPEVRKSEDKETFAFSEDLGKLNLS